MVKEKLEKAWKLFDSGELVDAETLYKECQNQINESEHNEYMTVLMGLIYVESFQGKYDDARIYGELLMEASMNDDEKHMAVHQAGMVERMAENYSEAMRLFQWEAEILSVSFPDDDMRFSVNLYEQGYVNMKMGNLALAEKKMLLSLEHAEKCGDDMCVGCACRGMGEIMNAYGNKESAIKYFQKAVEVFSRTGDEMAVNEVKEMM